MDSLGKIALPPLCVEMGFYAEISWKSRINIEINVCAHFYDEDASNLAPFYGSHIDGIV